MINFRLDRKDIDGTTVLKDSKIILPSSGFFFLRGPNGGGKTTLMGILAGRDSDYVGSLSVDGNQLEGDVLAAYADEMVSYCPQDALIFDNETALENILIPFSRHDKEKATAILSGLGLGKLIKSYAGDLSSGESQRLAVGRVLYSDRPIALLDEPTSFLDENNASLILNALVAYSKTHLVIMSTNEDIPALYRSFPVIAIENKSVSFLAPSNEEAADNRAEPLPKTHRGLGSLFRENRLFLLFLALLNSAFLACSIFFGAMLTTQANDVFRAYWSDYRRPEYGQLVFASNADVLPDNGRLQYSSQSFGMQDINQYGIDILPFEESLRSYDILSFVTVDEFEGEPLSSMDYSFLLGSFPLGENEIAVPKWSYILLCDSLGVGSPLTAETFALVSRKLTFDFTSRRDLTLTLSGVFDCPEPVGLDRVLSRDFGQQSYIRCYYFSSTHAIVNLVSMSGALSGYSCVFNSEANRTAFLNSDYFWNISFPLYEEDGNVARPLSYFTNSNYVAFYLFLGLTMIATFSIVFAYCAQNRNRFLLLRLAGADRNSLLLPRLSMFCGVMAASFLLGSVVGVGAAYVYQSYFLSLPILSGVSFLRIGADAILFPLLIGFIDCAIIVLLFLFDLFPKDTSRILMKAKEK